jgi:threonine/homoserine/homoserine lactone efflux protein
MIEWQLIATGILVGIAVSAPIGPINLICMRHSLSYGFIAGVLSGLGSVLGDGTFAAVAAFSLTALSDLILQWASMLQVLGAILLIAMGIRTYFATPVLTGLSEKPPLRRHVATLATTYVLTITNPATMMGFAAIFGGVGGLVTETASYGSALTLVIAVMMGSLFWWVFLARLVSIGKNRIQEKHLRRINQATGVIILGFGLVIAVKALSPYLSIT